MNIFKILLSLVIIIVLTISTQIGGLLFLTSLLFHKIIDKRFSHKWIRLNLKLLSFIILYLFSTFIIIPTTAERLGRVALPILETNHLQPATIWTCILNRNYVIPELKEAAFNISEKMNKKFPGTTINYLDANFPFINKFPLPPHRSHSDGKKLDLSFLYLDSKTLIHTDKIPSFIGYGVCEEPRSGEENIPDECKEKGYWQYNILRDIISQGNKNSYTFDSIRTKQLLLYSASQKEIGRIFLEPHLKKRLKLKSPKIRFHGCQAVRHDDHIHIQLR